MKLLGEAGPADATISRDGGVVRIRIERPETTAHVAISLDLLSAAQLAVELLRAAGARPELMALIDSASRDGETSGGNHSVAIHHKKLRRECPEEKPGDGETLVDGEITCAWCGSLRAEKLGGGS